MSFALASALIGAMIGAIVGYFYGRSVGFEEGAFAYYQELRAVKKEYAAMRPKLFIDEDEPK